jgi:hypothetical protein
MKQAAATFSLQVSRDDLGYGYSGWTEVSESHGLAGRPRAPHYPPRPTARLVVISCLSPYPNFLALRVLCALGFNTTLSRLGCPRYKFCLSCGLIFSYSKFVAFCHPQLRTRCSELLLISYYLYYIPLYHSRCLIC